MAPANITLKNGERAASFDGDADRVVYYFSNDGTFVLLVGRDLVKQFSQKTFKPLFPCMSSSSSALQAHAPHLSFRARQRRMATVSHP
jgi:phosphomannomutase